MSTYADFIRGKSQSAQNSGFAPTFMPDFLFDFQKSMVDWSVRKGRAALFQECVSADTIIHCEDGDHAIESLARRNRSVRIFVKDGESVALASATSPWINGFGRMYEVKTSSGKVIKASGNHRFLTPSGWEHLYSLSVGARLQVSDASSLRYIPGFGPSANGEGGPRCTH